MIGRGSALTSALTIRHISCDRTAFLDVLKMFNCRWYCRKVPPKILYIFGCILWHKLWWQFFWENHVFANLHSGRSSDSMFHLDLFTISIYRHGPAVEVAFWPQRSGIHGTLPIYFGYPSFWKAHFQYHGPHVSCSGRNSKDFEMLVLIKKQWWWWWWYYLVFEW